MGRINIKDAPYNCVGDGSTNDQVAFQAALSAGKNRVYAPSNGSTPGNYWVPGGIIIPQGVILEGDTAEGTFIQDWHGHSNVVSMSAQWAEVRDLAIYGAGTNSAPGPAMVPNCNALQVGGVHNRVSNVRAWGGFVSLWAHGVDSLFDNNDFAMGYGPANIATGGANWYLRNKVDHAPTGVGVTNSQPWPLWSPGSYSVGHVVTVGKTPSFAGWALQCVSAGTTGSVEPIALCYNVPITDGGVTWLLLAPVAYSGMLLGSNTGENQLTTCDFSSSAYSASVTFNVSPIPSPTGPAIAVFDTCIMSSPINIQAGDSFLLKGTECGAPVNISSSYTGQSIISGNIGVGSNFKVNVSGAARYTITDNRKCQVLGYSPGSGKIVANNTV